MYKKHDQRYFAMLNNAVALADTPLEGGNPTDAFEYYHYLLSRDFPADCPLFKLTEKEESAVNHGMMDLIAINALIESEFGKKFPQGEALEKALTEVISLIKVNSENTGACYLPSGWVADPGHFAALKCRKLPNGHFAISLLNHGGGMDYHQDAPSIGSKDRRIYQSEEFEIELDSKNGRELIQRLIELRNLTEMEHDYDSYMRSGINPPNEYSAGDLYGLLKLYGKEIHLTDKLDQKAVTPQRGGTCTITNTHAVARDILVNLDADLHKRKRYHFVLKLRSLIDAFEGYQQGDYDLNVLEWGLREFSVRGNKEYEHVLTHEEIIYCGELEKIIQERLFKDKQALIQAKSAAEPWPNPKGEAPMKQEVVVVKKEKEGREAKEKKTSEEEILAITPENIVKILSKKEDHWKKRSVDYRYHLLQSFPHCSGKDKDPFWDRVPREDIPEILKSLARFCDDLRNGVEQYGTLDQQRVLALSLTMYDIAAQLNEDKDYAFGLDDIYSDLNIFTDPETYFTIKRIVANFESRSIGKKRVLTNRVEKQGSEIDDTVDYLINVVLDMGQREEVLRLLGIKDCSDYQLFEKIMESFNSYSKSEDLEKTLGKRFLTLLKISGTAHAKGQLQKKYTMESKTENYHFSTNHFYREFHRKKELERERSDVGKHLPSLVNGHGNTNFRDYSENTLYHPQDDLLKQRENDRIYSSENISTYPYQLKVSGSINPDSRGWSFDKELKNLFEQLERDFRRIDSIGVKRIDSSSDVIRNAIQTKLNDLIFYSKNRDKKTYETISAQIHGFLLKTSKDNIEFARRCKETMKQISEFYSEIESNKLLFNELNEQFRHIECSPHLKIARTLTWMQKNPEKLKFKAIRTRLHELLFEYGRLDSALSHDTSLTIQRIKDCLTALIKHCKDEAMHNPDVLSWIGQLSNDLRNYAEVTGKLYDIKVDQYALPSLNDYFLSLIQSSSNEKTRSLLAETLILSFRHTSPLSLEDCALLLTYRLVMRVGGSSIACDEIWEGFLAEITAHIETNPDEFNRLINPLFVQYLKQPTGLRWTLNEGELTNEKTDFFIDLKEGSLQKRGMQHLHDVTERVIMDNSTLCSRLHLTHDLQLYWGGSEVESSDGKWSLSVDYARDYVKVRYVTRFIAIEGIQEKFTFKKEDEYYFRGNKSPFESDPYINTRYQHWICNKDNKAYFVRQDKSEFAYFYLIDSGLILQLKENKDGVWKRTGKVLLNLVAPNTLLEKQWVNRLGPLFGVSNIRCTASLMDNNTQAQVERIEHLVLGLNFSLNSDNRWCLEEDPDYYLTEEKSLAILEGLPSVLLLKNKHKKEEMRILIPGFSLCVGQKNNAFNQTKLIDYSCLCHETCRTFEYTLDEHQGLMGKTVESNLYLALLYRSLGDYKRAFQYLERAKTSQPLAPASLAIIMQALKHKIKSPLAAAFDMKLNGYIVEHQKKWSRINKPLDISIDWKKWIIEEQLPLYQHSISQYKTGVSILPAYCRLTIDELAVISEIKLPEESDESKELTPEVRVQKASSLKPTIFERKDKKSWDVQAEEIRNVFDQRFVHDSYESNTWRIFDKRFDFGSGFAYLYNNFSNLLREAVSKDPIRMDALHKKLYSLLMNDPRPVPYLYDLISILAFAAEHPDYFKDFNFPKFPENLHNYDFEGHKGVSNLKGKVVLDAGNVLIEHKNELINKKIYLIEFERYQNQVPAPIPLPADFKSNPVYFTIDPVKEEATCKHPLKSLADQFFTKSTRPVAEGPFALEGSDLKDASALELRLLDQLQRGHKENKTKTRPVYQVKEPFTLGEIKKSLQESKQRDVDQLKNLNAALYREANRTPLDKENISTKTKAHAYNLLLSRASEQHEIITLSDLFSAFLQQKPGILTQKNPYLTQEDIGPLFAQLADYALISSRVGQVNKAFEDIAGKNEVSELQAYELQLFAETVDKTRSYTIADYPEFLVYEYATKRILRDDQVEILIKIITLLEAKSVDPDEFHHALLQFAAGGGKTSVLIPILAHRFARKGFLPVVFNTNELYETGLEDVPKNLRAALMQNMEILERELEHQWTEAELKSLLQDLERWRGEEKCLLLKPITWHSLNITRKLAYFKGDLKLSTAVEEVLDFFKFKSVKLEDESQIISDSLQQCIKTYNKPLKLPQEDLNLILRFYDHLMGYEKGSAEIEQLAGIKTKRKHSITPANLLLLKNELAKTIVSEACFNGLNQDQLTDYLTKTDRTRPSWLLALHEQDPKTADLVVLARAFIQSHLPHILTLQHEKDYGTSVHEGDLTAAPKHEGKDVTSHFGDHTLVVALTIQMVEQNGLSATHVGQLLNSLVDAHRKERVWNPSLSLRTEAERWLIGFNSLGYQIKTIRDLTPELRDRLSTDPRFYKHPLVVKKFLMDFALPQVDVPPERQSSTAAELQAGFSRSLLLSATPGLPEVYPAMLSRENCFLEEAFEAEVIDTLLSPQNSQHCLLQATQTPTEFFEALPPEFLSSITTLIDRGAVLIDFNGEEVVKAYLDLKETHPRPTKTGVFFSKSQMHLQLEGKDRIDIPGTALVETLKKKGIKPEQFLLFLFISLSKTTGIDVKRPFHDVAGLTVGKEQTVTETIQAAMRERQLLDKNAQTVKWIMFESLYHEINPELEKADFDLRHVFYWMIKNEATQLKSKLINRAYQGLENEVQALVWKWWREDPEHFPEEFKTKLKQIQSISPWDLYEQPSADELSTLVLEDFRKKLYDRFGFKESDSRVPPLVRARIKKLIDETAVLIEKLPTPPKVQMNNEIQQEMLIETLQKEEQEHKQTLKKNIDSATEFEFSVETLTAHSVDALFTSDLEPIILPGCEGIQSRAPVILFYKQHFRVLAPLNPRETPKFDQLKPIEILLVEVNPDGSKRYRACTAIEADGYSLILRKALLTKADSSYAIITSEGEVLSHSKNTDPTTCDQWIQGQDTQKMLTYAQFLNGKINNPILMSQLIKEMGWSKSDYETVANTLIPMMVSNSIPYLVDNAALYNLCGWGNEPSQATDFADTTEQPEPAFTLPQEPLRIATVLEKDPGNFNLPPLEPERALEDYLFNTPIKKPKVIFKPPEVVVPKQKAPTTVPIVEVGSSSAADPFAAVKERLDLLEVDFKESNDAAPERDYEVMIMKLSVMQELNSLKSTIKTDISIGVCDNAIANKRIDSFIDNQLIPYKKTIHEAWLEGDKQRPVFDKLMIEFMNLKGRIYAEREKNDIPWEIANSIKNGEKIIPKIHKALEKNPREAKDLNDDFKKYIKTLEGDYKPLPPPKAPKKKWW